jgi:hypothetical protein
MGIPEVKIVRAPRADFTLSRNVERHKAKKKTQNADPTDNQGQQHRLGEHLADHPKPACSEGEPHGNQKGFYFHGVC